MPGESAAVILLDSHALVWARTEQRRLSPAARRAISAARAADGVAVAAITLYEMSRLFALGHLRPVGTVGQAVDDLVDGVTIFPLTVEIAAFATSFPADFPRDPADRLIAATARVHALPLVTADRAIRQSPVVETIW